MPEPPVVEVNANTVAQLPSESGGNWLDDLVYLARQLLKKSGDELPKEKQSTRERLNVRAPTASWPQGTHPALTAPCDPARAGPSAVASSLLADVERNRKRGAGAR